MQRRDITRAAAARRRTHEQAAGPPPFDDADSLTWGELRQVLHEELARLPERFDRAWTTILDTHVTTLVSAVILAVAHAGPVSGFGVTLIFGLLANLFTAVFVSRVIFDAVLSRKARGEALSI